MHIKLIGYLAATRIQIINEAIGLKFNCSAEDLASGACVAQSGEQLSVIPSPVPAMRRY